MSAKITWTKVELENLPKTIGAAINNESRYFFTGKKCNNGHIAPRHSDSEKCVDCRRVSNKKQTTAYRKKIKSGKHNVISSTRLNHSLSRSLEMKLYVTAKTRARKKGVEFTIKVTDIKIPSMCPIFMIPLDPVWGGVDQNNKNRFNKLSLDRLDPRFGYTPENIIVVSYRANMIKGDGFPDEHRKIGVFLEKHGL